MMYLHPEFAFASLPLLHCSPQQNRHPEASKVANSSSRLPNTTFFIDLRDIHIPSPTTLTLCLHLPHIFTSSSHALHMPRSEQSSWSDAKFYLGLGLSYFFSFIIYFKLLSSLGVQSVLYYSLLDSLFRGGLRHLRVFLTRTNYSTLHIGPSVELSVLKDLIFPSIDNLIILRFQILDCYNGFAYPLPTLASRQCRHIYLLWTPHLAPFCQGGPPTSRQPQHRYYPFYALAPL